MCRWASVLCFARGREWDSSAAFLPVRPHPSPDRQTITARHRFPASLQNQRITRRERARAVFQRHLLDQATSWGEIHRRRRRPRTDVLQTRDNFATGVRQRDEANLRARKTRGRGLWRRRSLAHTLVVILSWVFAPTPLMHRRRKTSVEDARQTSFTTTVRPGGNIQCAHEDHTKRMVARKFV